MCHIPFTIAIFGTFNPVDCYHDQKERTKMLALDENYICNSFLSLTLKFMH